ncbi:hypothetical protein BAE44_0013138 [Dichanthelium oligosanthes]|uniref:Uncharacterized protein n=1 Tax=Dichanthelium oligosanthes TaxID=888268 RepID=A0A1E5VL57_9POAL|nr:hypothetical protein BAE44_0013138 [Dichanthelium oligosanthes]
MSGTPDAGSDSQQGFTCSALLMCLYLPGLSKKKPEAEVAAASGAAETAPAPNEPVEQAPPDAPDRDASLEKSECASLYSGNNIVFDFVEEEGDGQEEQGGARAIHGYCPSPCFDLPVELIRAGERFGVVAAADSDASVTAAFVFDDGHGGGTLQKMASCLAPGAEGDGEPRPPHLLRFLSASGRSSVPQPPVMVMPSRAAPLDKAVDGDCELGDSACVQRLTAGCRESVV